MEAAQTLSREPGAMQLRYLQTAREITSEKTSTFIFPLPVDLLSFFFKSSQK
jgi:hypothetical protein